MAFAVAPGMGVLETLCCGSAHESLAARGGLCFVVATVVADISVDFEVRGAEAFLAVCPVEVESRHGAGGDAVVAAEASTSAKSGVADVVARCEGRDAAFVGKACDEQFSGV